MAKRAALRHGGQVAQPGLILHLLRNLPLPPSRTRRPSPSGTGSSSRTRPASRRFEPPRFARDPAPDRARPLAAILEFEAPAAPKVEKSRPGISSNGRRRLLFPSRQGRCGCPGLITHSKNLPAADSTSGRRIWSFRSRRVSRRTRSPRDRPKVDKGIRSPRSPRGLESRSAPPSRSSRRARVVAIARSGKATLGERRAAVAPAKSCAASSTGSPTVETLGGDARGYYSDLTRAVKRYLERTTGDPVSSGRRSRRCAGCARRASTSPPR